MAPHGNTYDYDLSEDYTLADLVAIKSRQSRPKVVALCGSTMFSSKFRGACLEETCAGHIILSLGWHLAIDQDYVQGLRGKQILDLLRLWIIDLADEMLVLNVEGYMDDVMMQEYQYASDQRKPIRFLMNMCGQCNQWVNVSELQNGMHAGCPVPWRG